MIFKKNECSGQGVAFAEEDYLETAKSIRSITEER